VFSNNFFYQLGIKTEETENLSFDRMRLPTQTWKNALKNPNCERNQLGIKTEKTKNFDGMDLDGMMDQKEESVSMSSSMRTFPEITATTNVVVDPLANSSSVFEYVACIKPFSIACLLAYFWSLIRPQKYNVTISTTLKAK
jgi:hypothetical protein